MPLRARSTAYPRARRRVAASGADRAAIVKAAVRRRPFWLLVIAFTACSASRFHGVLSRQEANAV
ncbi:hypothetical protein [Nonomuraea sp. NPDC046570]|uniref:hypothetical protein n=1 Tax=Nonomuraea sp. NPDC046570 TaxID=3155255 RepID=UPI00340C6AE6